MNEKLLSDLTARQPLFAQLKREDLDEVDQALNPLPYESRLHFFLSSRGSLGGISVAEALARGMKDKVISAARAWAE